MNKVHNFQEQLEFLEENTKSLSQRKNPRLKSHVCSKLVNNVKFSRLQDKSSDSSRDVRTEFRFEAPEVSTVG